MDVAFETAVNVPPQVLVTPLAGAVTRIWPGVVGSVSLIATPLIATAALFVSVMRSADGIPEPTVAGVNVLTTEGTGFCTVVVAVAMLLARLGSALVLATVAVFVSVPPIVAAAVACATIVKLSAPAGSVAIENVTVPAAPTAGVVTVQPGGALADTNVVLAGSGSETTTPVAGSGPGLVS